MHHDFSHTGNALASFVKIRMLSRLFKGVCYAFMEVRSRWFVTFSNVVQDFHQICFT